MDKTAEIKKALREALGMNPNLAITAKIVSVENDTCTVELLSGLKISDVRLKATINDETDTLLIIPKLGSDVVMISQTGELSGLIIIKVDAVEKIEFKKGNFEFVLDGETGKVTLKKQGANFGSLINSLIDTIVSAQITTPTGPGTISPATIAQLNELKVKFNLILNSN